VRFLYEAGRESAVKSLVEQAGILQILKEIGNSKKNYILFNRYMEALVAFHKFNGGKD
jgi:CRISPR-associated protein Csm2